MSAQIATEVIRPIGGPIVRQALAEAKARASRTSTQQLWDMMSPQMKARLEHGSKYGQMPREPALLR